MKEGRASQTAELVCMARAVAHAAKLVPQFNDPTAMMLLPEDGRQRVEGFLSNDTPKGFRAAFRYQHLDRLAKLMAARTVAIDEFVRRGPTGQVVILGAGLDGRAWRMPELSESIVFEVDHPDSQRDKRARIGALTQTAREVRFVPVDFVRQKLDDALGAAGHDPQQPTAWIWEGVVMYLTPAQVEATLKVVAQRSAKNSRLCVVYHSPAPILWLVNFVVRRLGEPLRSSFTVNVMRDLLANYGFAVERDEDAHTIGVQLSGDIAMATKYMRHTRIAMALREA